MDNSFFDIFHHARRILCKCPECDEISRLGEIQIKSGKKSSKTWLDDHQKNINDFDIAKGKFDDSEEEERNKGIARGRMQAEQDMRDLIKNSLMLDYQQMDYDPRDIKLISHPIDFVVFDGANKVRMKEQDFVKEVLLLSKKTDNPYFQKLHKSVHDVIENKQYDWKTAKVIDNIIELE